MGIEPYFRFVIGHEDTNRAKCSGLPLLLALQMLRKEMPNIANSEILVVGDSVDRDILPAKKLGFQAALSNYSQKTVEAAIADYRLTCFKDLLAVL